jgi:3-keto-L-gulonate-6-phosphate decarboxylase
LRVNAIRSIIPNKHLAIYGGITLENIKEYSELASYIILKKEISNKDNKFDKNKLMEFINYVK